MQVQAQVQVQKDELQKTSRQSSMAFEAQLTEMFSKLTVHTKAFLLLFLKAQQVLSHQNMWSRSFFPSAVSSR